MITQGEIKVCSSDWPLKLDWIKKTRSNSQAMFLINYSPFYFLIVTVRKLS